MAMRVAVALPAASILLAVSAAGCAPRGDFPSLAPRPVERQLAEEQPAVPAPEPPADPALAARVSELVGRARAGDAAFTTALAAARSATSRAGAAGSDSWIAAQSAISRVEAVRADLVTALAELDRLGIERASQPTSGADREMVRAAQAEVQATADRQHEQLEALRASLSPA
jgi:hypothetical protein